MNDNKIKIVVDDIKIEGEVIHRYSRDFEIKITSPFLNLTGGSHIPYFADHSRTFDGEYGDRRIEGTLKSLYKMGKFLAKNMEKIKKEYQLVRKELNEIEEKGLTEEKFKVKRLALRKDMRKGKITSKQYQKLLTPLRKKYEELNCNTHLKIGKFFDTNFPMCIPYDTEKKITAILEGQLEFIYITEIRR